MSVKTLYSSFQPLPCPRARLPQCSGRQWASNCCRLQHVQSSFLVSSLLYPKGNGVLTALGHRALTRPRCISSSTPGVPLLGSQGVYGSGDRTESSFPHPRGVQEAEGGDVGAWDPRISDLQKLKELELHGNGARPFSRDGSCMREKAAIPVSRYPEELVSLIPSVTGSSKPPSFRTNGIRKDLLISAHSLAQNNNGVAGGPEEDLVAMGTLWSTSRQRRQSRSTCNTNVATYSSSTTSSNKSVTASVSNGSGGGSSVLISGSGAFPITRRSIAASSSTTSQASLTLSSPSAMGNVIKSNKDVEPKYSDPVPGAPASFQQRLMELAALEAETVRWERSKKVKKKPLRQDKES